MGNMAGEGGEYMGRKSVESLKMAEGYGKWLSRRSENVPL
jgi:hypothetical protein